MSDPKNLDIYYLPDLPSPAPTQDDVLNSVKSQLESGRNIYMSGAGSQVFNQDTPGIWLGSGSFSTAPFSVSMAGALIASSATISGSITATSGTIGGWTITATTLTATGIILDAGNQKITVGSGTPNLIIDGGNKYITTSTYSSGAQGWRILQDGSADFNNIAARGELHTQVLSSGSVHVTAGSTLLALSGGKLKSDFTSATSPTTFNVDIVDPPTGHTQAFSTSDILRIKDGSGNDNWLTVSSVSDQTTFFRYVCTKSNGSNATFRAGAAVADYGQSGQGLIYSTVDGTNAPYLSVQTHAGSPWSALTERVRMGNLNGYLDYATNIYGFAVGSSSGTNANITIDPTNGIRIRNGTTNVITLDQSGNASIANNMTVGGSLSVSTSGNIKSGQTAYNTGAGWFLEYNSGTPRLSIGDGTDTNSLTWNGSTLSINGSSISNNDVYGNGADGDATISADTSLTRDTFYNNLTVNSSKTLTTAGYRLFVKGTLTINSSGVVGYNGTAGANGNNGSGASFGTGGTGGASLSDGTLKGSEVGKDGGRGGGGGNGGSGNPGVAGSNGTNITNSFASSFSQTGATGGSSGTPANLGGAAGTSGTITASTIRPYSSYFAVPMLDFQSGSTPVFLRYNGNPGSSGGGGGGSSGTLGAKGGGGGGAGGNGSGGGTVVIAARTIVNNGSIQAVGGAGGNGGNGASSDNAGDAAGGGGGAGGAGGPGGIITLIYSSLTGSGTVTAAAGATGTPGTGGTGHGTYGNGQNGGTPSAAPAGVIIQLPV